MRGKALKWTGFGLVVLLLEAGTATAAPVASAGDADIVHLGTVATGHDTTITHPLDPASAPDVVKLAQATPSAAPFVWSASKAADGSITLDGFVPSKEVGETLLDSISKLAADNTKLASGQPDDFAANAVSALDLLSDLDSGKVAFDGALWSVTGAVATADESATAKSAFDASPLKAIGATYLVSTGSGPAASPATAGTAAVPLAPAAATPLAPAATAAATPASPPAAVASGTVAAPNYAWSAEKAGDGTLTFNGTVPTEVLKNLLLARGGAKSLDNSTVAQGAPNDFVDGALHGLDALMALDSGKLLYAGGTWSLAGLAKDDNIVTAAHAALATLDTKTWQFDIKTPVKTAAATSAPATTTAPSSTASSTSATAATTGTTATAAPTAPAMTVPATATPTTTATTTASPTPTPPYLFSATKVDGGAISASGGVPTDAIKTYLADITKDATAGGIKVAANPPEGFTADLIGGLDALERLSEGQLAFDGKTWSLKGHASFPEIRTSVLAHLAALPGGKDWAADVAGPSPLEQCRNSLSSFPNNAINFDATTHFAKGTDAAIDTLASDLGACPAARVDVEGFTSSDGELAANMALSVARAEAVVDALVKRGVDAQRLYAVGYGETLPLAPNTTPANKAMNRRIEIKLEDGSAK